MAGTLFDTQDRVALAGRVDRLAPGSPRRWGRMTPAGMAAHLSDTLRMPLGQITVAPAGHWALRLPPVRHAIIHWLPFPRGAPTAPEIIARQPDDCAAEIEALKALMEAFAARPPAEAFSPHPAFGRLSGRDWGALMYKHMDHHLRQFGL